MIEDSQMSLKSYLFSMVKLEMINDDALETTAAEVFSIIVSKMLS